MKNRIKDFAGASTAQAAPESGSHASDSASKNSMLDHRALLAQVERTISEHPVLSVSIGMCAGVALGWLIKRR